MEITSFIKLFEDSIDGITPGSVRPETALADVPQWDSLAVLTMLAQVDAEYGVQISGAEIQQCRLVSDLFRTVEQKVAAKKT